jgi:hypothetical protein
VTQQDYALAEGKAKAAVSVAMQRRNEAADVCATLGFTFEIHEIDATMIGDAARRMAFSARLRRDLGVV